MKPLLDRMIDMIVAGLSGKAKAFYELEFGFFDEVTSISGKLKPYIKKSKPEKKVSYIVRDLPVITHRPGKDRRGDGEDQARGRGISTEQPGRRGH